jgi:hypothetical protein
MEGQMDNEMRTENYEFDPNAPIEVELENVADATGYWFAVAALFAVLIAAVIIYRAANSNTIVASNEILAPTAQLHPAAQPALLR